MANLPPFQQGGLDSLCGLYSVVNAYRFISHANDNEAQDLFNDIVRHIARKRILSKFLIDGMTNPHMLMILSEVVGQRISGISVPWRGVPTPDLDTFWKSLQSFLDGTPRRVVILGMGGYHDHWTVIEAITDKSITLYDSALIRRLPRYRCTTSTTSRRRKHLLLPTQTYLLSNPL